VLTPGTTAYADAWEFQRELFEKKKTGDENDYLILLEHPHTYTLGKLAKGEHLLLNKTELANKGIDVFDIDRGGDITYHGPGQLVGYPIIDLTKWKQDAHLFLRTLEQVIINFLSELGIEAKRKESLTGVWIEDRKIAAIGIKISRWITMHGFALNVCTDLNYFDGIVPCGIKDKSVTSIEKELDSPMKVEECIEPIIASFKREFDYSLQ
jgi:lipoyl(octanoyl) transferase